MKKCETLTGHASRTRKEVKNDGLTVALALVFALVAVMAVPALAAVSVLTIGSPTTQFPEYVSQGGTVDVTYTFTTDAASEDFLVEIFDATLGNAGPPITDTWTGTAGSDITHTTTFSLYSVIDEGDYEVKVTPLSSGSIPGVTQADAVIVDNTDPVVTLLTPIGGEILAGTDTFNITWTASDDNFGDTPITLWYSINGGESYNQIGEGAMANTGSYTWTVPTKDSEICLVKVTATDLAGRTAEDVSDANFTIDSTPPTVTVLTPSDTGITLTGGEEYPITWDATDNFTAALDIVIDLEYTEDDGDTWVSIATGEANDGSYTWTVPSTTSDTCKVKVIATDLAGNEGNDVSDNLFEIFTDVAPPTAPTDLEATAGIASVDLTWTASTDPEPSSDIDHYNVYRTTTSPCEVDPANLLGTATETNYGDTAVADGATYYYVVTCVDGVGHESDPSNEASATYTWSAPEPVTETIDLYVGWNLISLPVIPASPSTDAMLADVLLTSDDIVWGYNAQSGYWSFRKLKPYPVGGLTTMVDGQGYWIYVSEAGSFDVEGSEMPIGGSTLPAYNIYPGWNLIGFKSTTEMAWNAYLETAGASVIQVLGYDPTKLSYSLVEGMDTLVPGQGYWLLASASGVISPPLSE